MTRGRSSRGRGAIRATTRGRFNVRRGATRGRHAARASLNTDDNHQDIQLQTSFDVNGDPKPFFTNPAVTIDQHIQAQSTNLPRYLATLYILHDNGVEIGQKAKSCILAAAWCRHDHVLASSLLLDRKLFTLTEILKAVTMLDAARQIRVFEKKLKRLELAKTKASSKKLGKIKNDIDNLTRMKPSTGSVSGAVARHIQRWTRTLNKEELEYFALHMSTEPWKKLADVVHFNPSKDFPALTWFLPFCFGASAPSDSMVSRCRDLTNANVNELLKEFRIPYSHLKGYKDQLNNESKARIAANEEKLDTILWHYEDIQCPEVDEILGVRLNAGERVTLPYGKLMERLLTLRSMRAPQRYVIYSQDGWGDQEDQFKNDGPNLAEATKITSPFYKHLISIAEDQLNAIKLPLESPVAVLGDASPSMDVAIRTATILSSLLTAICSAELTFFCETMFRPSFVPKTIEEILDLAINTRTYPGTANAAGLLPYYNDKKIVKTFVMVTDEEENSSVQMADGTSIVFFDLFMKYRAEIYPSKLVLISFLRRQTDVGQIYRKFLAANVPDIIQVSHQSVFLKFLESLLI